jgi:DNA polymerase-3 subunit delta
MTHEQFLARLAKNGPEPAYLFLGPEAYQRERCRKALLEAALPATMPVEDRENGLSRHDLDQISLASAIDDARSLSLFAPRRVIWLGRAEAALPRTVSKTVRATEPEEETSGDAGSTALASYLRDPAPATVLVIDCSRFDFDGEDKAKLERVETFYAAVAAKVEFRPIAPEAARGLAQKLAKEAGLRLGLTELALLLEATGGEALRIATEIEKLRLYAGPSRQVTAEDIAALVPDAQATTIFALVAALGRGDRMRALEILEILSREGEYMPLALTFLATQFRMALAAREAGLRGAGQIQAHFTKLGARMWPQRAREVERTVDAFSRERLERAIQKLFEADRSLRDARPDDRIVMEEMVLELTAR